MIFKPKMLDNNTEKAIFGLLMTSEILDLVVIIVSLFFHK